MALHFERVSDKGRLGFRVRRETVLFLKDTFLTRKDIKQDREKNNGGHQIQKYTPHRTHPTPKGGGLVQIDAGRGWRLAGKTKCLPDLGTCHVIAERPY